MRDLFTPADTAPISEDNAADWPIGAPSARSSNLRYLTTMTSGGIVPQFTKERFVSIRKFDSPV